MRSITIFAVLTGTAIASPLSLRDSSTSSFTTVHPGGIKDLIITKENTINGTVYPSHGSTVRIAPRVAGANAYLRLSFVNNFSGGAVNAYVTGKDFKNQVVLLGRNGQWIYPSSGGSKVPIPIMQDVTIPLKSRGGILNINLPDYVSSARVWVAEGKLQFFMVATSDGDSIVMPSPVNPSDPSANVNWGFIELTNTSGGIYANTSYVDFVGLVLGMKLTNSDGTSATTPGLQPGSVATICNELVSQAKKDGQIWNKLCMADKNGKPLRVLSPGQYGSLHQEAFQGYYDNYTNQVWKKYTTSHLSIDTQQAAGIVKCRVVGGLLKCNGDNRGYSKPSIADIWGCNTGPFAIKSGDNSVHHAVVPRLCAAFVRSTLLLPGGNKQPSLQSPNYYTASPTHHYSHIVHKYEVGGTGYTFSYDDVAATGDINSSGVVSSGNPQTLTIYVGGL
jgi:hypothetical protein